MDYKNKYLELKKKMIGNQDNYKLNSKIIEQLSNLVFVINNKVLGDDAHAIILSLIDDFNRIGNTEIRNNLELSQFYGSSEIVLKYIDYTVCVNNSKKTDSSDIECDISRGLIRFYVKKCNGNSCRYHRIKVVYVDTVESLNKYADGVYQNNDEIIKLENACVVALSRSQTDAIKSAASNGQLDASTPEEIVCTTNTVNNIFKESKNAVVQAQMEKIDNQRYLSSTPSQTAVDSANTVSQNIMNSLAASAMEVTAILVPNNQPLSLQTSPTRTVPAMVGGDGIKADTTGDNSMNTKVANNRSSIAVDANLAIIPNKNIVSKDLTDKVASTTKDVTNKTGDILRDVADKSDEIVTTTVNKSGDIIQVIAKKTGNVFDDARKYADKYANDARNVIDDYADKVVAFFTGKNSSNSLVKVNGNLRVMTPLPKDQAKMNTPSPHNVSPTQKSVINKFNNKLTKNRSISIDKDTYAYQTVSNGNQSRRKSQDDVSSLQLSEMSLRYKSTRNVHKNFY